MTEPVPSAKDYGARFAGFAHEFLVGTGFPEGAEVPMTGPLLSAITVAWEDHLIRQRRAEKPIPTAAGGRP